MSHDDCDGEPGAKSPQRLAARLPPPTRRSVYVPPRTARVPREQAPPTQMAARGPRRGLTDSPKTRFERQHAARCCVEAAQSARCSTESCPGVGAEPEARRLTRGEKWATRGRREHQTPGRAARTPRTPDTLVLSGWELGRAALLARPPGLGVTPQAAEQPRRCARADGVCAPQAHTHARERAAYTADVCALLSHMCVYATVIQPHNLCVCMRLPRVQQKLCTCAAAVRANPLGTGQQ